MILKYDPDVVEEFISSMIEMEECINNMGSKLEHIKENIELNNSGDSIKRVVELLETKITGFSEAKEKVEEFREYINDYKTGLEEYDTQGIITKDYYIDTDELQSYVKKITKIIQDIEYDKFSRHFNLEVEDFERNKRKFYDVDELINIESEYEGDEITKSYIRKRQEEIEEELINQKRNEVIMEEVQDLIKGFRG